MYKNFNIIAISFIQIIFKYSNHYSMLMDGCFYVLRRSRTCECSRTLDCCNNLSVSSSSSESLLSLIVFFNSLQRRMCDFGVALILVL